MTGNKWRTLHDPSTKTGAGVFFDKYYNSQREEITHDARAKNLEAPRRPKVVIYCRVRQGRLELRGRKMGANTGTGMDFAARVIKLSPAKTIQIAQNQSCFNTNFATTLYMNTPRQLLQIPGNTVLAKSGLDQGLSFPQKLDMALDVKHLHIVYYKWDRCDSVSSDQNISIDYTEAVSEMDKLDHTFDSNHIGFINRRKSITIQFIKNGQDSWYVEEVIHPGVNWEGYVWYSNTDNAHLYDMVWRFYHEEPFAMAVPGWKVKQVKH